jgi:indolepyruvate ferredoxin oxidoreductase
VRDLSTTLDEAIDRRAAFLRDYQDASYAERYRTLVSRVREAEERTVANVTALTDAVARGCSS